MIANETTNINFQSDIDYTKSLNKEQQNTYDIILDCVLNDKNGMFFIDGLGDTGKAYLYNALLFGVRSRNLIALATTSSGVAASLLSVGRTRHSRFKIPLQALDKMSRDITECQLPFGGKVIVCGVDIHQVLPAVQKGTKDDIMKLALVENMRAKLDPSFCEYLLNIGNRIERIHLFQMILLPEDITINFEDEFKSLKELIDIVFLNFQFIVNNELEYSGDQNLQADSTIKIQFYGCVAVRCHIVNVNTIGKATVI
ncbi:uncharacterized protein LOC111371119 [Olea europaea var. sylvestris]|uniref:uncharacterized protein LOC111371119 n=1 Tax=Olea europaea var. sylvestris TaxID=158386 RepID=UPI000C1D6D7B|nr:uncharacterized protein LOC111371119 [Olea europaea var. sylvestris]